MTQSDVTQGNFPFAIDAEFYSRSPPSSPPLVQGTTRTTDAPGLVAKVQAGTTRCRNA